MIRQRWIRTFLVLLLASVSVPAVAQQPMPSAAANDLQTILDLAGWPQTRIEELASQAEISSEDELELLELAIRLRRADDVLANSAEDSAAAKLVGQVNSVRQISLSKNNANRLGVTEYFVCQIESDHGETTSLLTLTVPQKWLASNVLPQPVATVGVSIPAASPWLIAPRVAWHPSTPVAGLVNFGETVLGNMRFDVGMLDAARDGRALMAVEHDLFYELLTKMRDIGANQLARFAAGNLSRYTEPWRSSEKPAPLVTAVLKAAEQGRYSVGPLFNDASAQRGQLYVFEGLVRRAVRVAVEREPAARFGVDHYYELEMFTANSQNLPLVFCVLELPDGFPIGDAIKQEARLAGFFVKRWAYRTRRPASAGDRRSHDRRQYAPLLVGRAPIPLAPATSDRRHLGLIAGGAFVLALLATWAAVWRFGQSDKAFDRTIRARLERAPNSSDFSQLEAKSEAESVVTDEN